MSHLIKKAFSLIEVVVAVALFAIFAAVMLKSTVSAHFDVSVSKDNLVADYYLQEGVEAVRSIRDDDFTNLTDGTHGLTDSGGHWSFSGSNDSFGKFSRSIAVSTLEEGRTEIVSTVTWDSIEGISHSISSTMRLTNWQDPIPVILESEYLLADISAISLSGGDKKLNGITIENSGDSDITITKMTVSWTGGDSGNYIKDITIGGTEVWATDAVSGEELDITDVILTSGAGPYSIDEIKFQKSVSGADITIVFEMIDESLVTISSIQP